MNDVLTDYEKTQLESIRQRDMAREEEGYNVRQWESTFFLRIIDRLLKQVAK